MGNYTIISDIGNLLVSLLRENMVPDMIVNADAVGLCSPADKENITLGLYLYDIRESESVRINGLQAMGINRQKYPPIYLELYYMVTAYSMSDHKFRASEEHRMLGRAMQLFRDHPSIDLQSLSFDGDFAGDVAKIELVQMDGGEKVKLWSHPDSAYRLSLFYKVSPIPLDSARTVPVKRVTKLDFSVEEQEKE